MVCANSLENGKLDIIKLYKFKCRENELLLAARHIECLEMYLLLLLRKYVDAHNLLWDIVRSRQHRTTHIFRPCYFCLFFFYFFFYYFYYLFLFSYKFLDFKNYCSLTKAFLGNFAYAQLTIFFYYSSIAVLYGNGEGCWIEHSVSQLRVYLSPEGAKNVSCP